MGFLAEYGAVIVAGADAVIEIAAVIGFDPDIALEQSVGDGVGVAAGPEGFGDGEVGAAGEKIFFGGEFVGKAGEEGIVIEDFAPEHAFGIEPGPGDVGEAMEMPEIAPDLAAFRGIQERVGGGEEEGGIVIVRGRGRGGRCGGGGVYQGGRG